jgi:hypothetical protein
MEFSKKEIKLMISILNDERNNLMMSTPETKKDLKAVQKAIIAIESLLEKLEAK